MNRSLTLFRYSALALAASTLMACSNNDDFFTIPAPVPVVPVVADTIVLTSGNKLVGFAQADTSKTITRALTGLPSDETLVGIDFRPSNGLLYAVSRVGTAGAKLYIVNLTTGALETPVVLTSAASGNALITLAAGNVGVDFNPVANRLRVIDSAGQNLRINVDVATGNTTIDAPLSPVGSATQATGLTEVAYTNSFDATCRTTLFYVNSSANQLALSLDPNGGKFRVAGGLGTVTAPLGFDVRTGADGTTNTLQALATVGGALSLVDINATSGVASNPRTVTLASGETAIGLAAFLPASVPATQAAGNLVALTSDGELLTFNRPATGSPGKACTGPIAITGLPTATMSTPAVTILGIDTRPNTGALIGLGSDGRLYTLNSVTGAATAPVALIADGNSTDTKPDFTALSGASFGLDFNPTVDRLRVVSDTGQNLRVNVDTGATIVDGNLTGAATGATAVGYTNSIGGGNPIPSTAEAASTTALFYLDTGVSGNSKLATTSAPNDGITAAVGTVADTGIDLTDASAFEIEGRTGVAYIAGKTAAAAGSSLYTVDLSTGVINPALGAFAGNKTITGLATNGSFAATVFALTTLGGAQAITSVAPGAPAATTMPVALTGLATGEVLVGIDFRPSSVGAAGNVLFGVSSANKLYTVNTASGAVTAIGTVLTAAATGDTSGAAMFATLSGAKFGVDFNPVPDRIRVVSDTQQNLRINPNNAQVNSDINLAPAGSIVSAAYTRNFDGLTGGTALYGIDNASSMLVRIGADPSDGSACTDAATDANPNCGDVINVGALGQTIIGDVGFDIVGGQNGFALTSFGTATSGQTTLYRIILGTGAVTAVGLIGGGTTTTPIQDIAIGLAVKP